MRIKKISPTTPANGNIENQYGTSQTNAYSEEYSNNTFATKDVATTSANGLMSSTDKAKLDNGEVYSTTEQVIGTWIDGKPIYRYVYESSSVTTHYEISGVNHVNNFVTLDFKMYRKDYPNMVTPIPGRLTHSTMYIDIRSVNKYDAKTEIDIDWGPNYSSSTVDKVQFVIEYTKTTD